MKFVERKHFSWKETARRPSFLKGIYIYII